MVKKKKEKIRDKKGRNGGSGDRPRAFVFPFAGDENYELGRQALEDPEDFIRRAGLDVEDLQCRDEVHEAMARGEAFTAAVAEAGFDRALPKHAGPVRKMAEKHLGKDFEVAVIPYGLKFRERVPVLAAPELTATASGTITFLDSDADVDF